MAITIANLTKGGTATNGNSVNTASVTIASGKSYLMWFCTNRGGDMTASSTGWTLKQHLSFDNCKIDLLYRDGDGTSAAITIGCSGTWTAGAVWIIDEVTGAKSGSDLIVQVATGQNGGSGTPAVTLASFADATNNAPVLGFTTDGGMGTVTPEAGYTALAQQASGSFCDGATEYKVGEDTSPSASISSIEWAAIGVEIAMAAAGGAPVGPLTGSKLVGGILTGRRLSR